LSKTIAVWDRLVRVLHWSLVIGAAVARITEDSPSLLHDGAGYAVFIIVFIRLIWGLIRPKFARFHSFVRRPSETLDYVRTVARSAERRHLGHNALGGWMIVALLSCVALTSFTGWLYTTDRFWGLSWMEDIHETFAIILIILIALHIAGVIFSSLRQRENLVRSMTHGRKEERPGDV